MGNYTDCPPGVSALCALPRDTRLGWSHQPISRRADRIAVHINLIKRLRNTAGAIDFFRKVERLSIQ